MDKKVKVVIGLLVTEIEADKLKDAVINVDFQGDFLVQICQFNESWAVINAFDGWGNNCKSNFIGKKVHILESD